MMRNILNSGIGVFSKINNLYVLHSYLSKWNFDNVLHFKCNNKPLADTNQLDLITFAFNNENVIAHQIRLLRKYILDPYQYTVVDNSPDLTKREKILRLCKNFDVAYISLPPNPYTGKYPSLSHGLALNWIYQHYISHRKAAYFGFIDHDIFPISPTKIMDFLQNNYVYGLLQEREKLWYLWAGFCFFNYSYVADKKLDFMPYKGTDTGGANWRPIYRYLDKEKIPRLKHEYGRLRDGDDPQSDWFEYIGDWLHTFNASNWKKVKDKNILVDRLLNKY